MPGRIEAVMVPGLSQLPGSIEGKCTAKREVLRIAPDIKVFFRPEEKDRTSGIGNVFPPAGGRYRKVNQRYLTGIKVP